MKVICNIFIRCQYNNPEYIIFLKKGNSERHVNSERYIHKYKRLKSDLKWSHYVNVLPAQWFKGSFAATLDAHFIILLKSERRKEARKC